MATYKIDDISQIVIPPPFDPDAPSGDSDQEDDTHVPPWIDQDTPQPPPPPSDAGEPGEPGEPEDSEPGEPGDGEPGEPGDGEPGDGEPGKSEDESDDDISDSGEPDLDKIFKDIEQKISGREEISGNEPVQPSKSQQSGKGGGASGGGGGNAGYQTRQQDIKPKFSWKQLMDQFISSKKDTETTYKKIHRGSVTGVSAASEFGAGAIKPGQRELEDAFKLLFVFDSSGSMAYAIPGALAEAEQLISQNYNNVDAALGVTMFASSPNYFAANLAAKKFWPIASFSELEQLKAPTNTLPISQLFNVYLSGGTDFSQSMVAQLSMMASKDYNIIMFTDTDILYGNNWDNFLKLYRAHPRNLYLILDNRASYVEVIKKLGIQPNTFGHL